MILFRNIFAVFVFAVLVLLSFLVIPGRAQMPTVPTATAFTTALEGTLTADPAVSVLLTPYVLPCGQGSNLLGLLPCGPESQQGVFVHIKSADAGFDSYGVTIRYRTAAGDLKTAAKSVKRAEDGWTTVAFTIGRVKTPYLPDGVVIDGVDVVKQTAPVTVPIGERYFTQSPFMDAMERAERRDRALWMDRRYNCVAFTSMPPKTVCTDKSGANLGEAYFQ